jgi:cysteine desulfuration protein SufE
MPCECPSPLGQSLERRPAADETGMSSVPAALAEVVSDFADMAGQDKLQLLLEFANELPPLPADLEEAAMEPVPECQSPLFLHVDASDREHVRLYFSAPAEAPTTRGFAAILAAGLDDHSADEILDVPDDFYTDLGLAALISPLRLRGMSAMLARIKRRLRAA